MNEFFLTCTQWVQLPFQAVHVAVQLLHPMGTITSRPRVYFRQPRDSLINAMLQAALIAAGLGVAHDADDSTVAGAFTLETLETLETLV